jgi:hypothetical protein
MTANMTTEQTEHLDLGTGPQPDLQPAPVQYAILEIFGHRRHGGRIEEASRFGVRGVQIDVPLAEGGIRRHWYPGASIFGTEECSEREAREEAGIYEDPPTLRETDNLDPLAAGTPPALALLDERDAEQHAAGPVEPDETLALDAARPIGGAMGR